MVTALIIPLRSDAPTYGLLAAWNRAQTASAIGGLRLYCADVIRLYAEHAPELCVRQRAAAMLAQIEDKPNGE
jgi:hypothetical protein